MRFLVDEAVSHLVVSALIQDGHDAVHVRDRGLRGVDDASILAHAMSDGRVIVTQDTDFGTLLVTGGHAKPSVVIIRSHDARPARHVELLRSAVPACVEALSRGAIVVISDHEARVRMLRSDDE